MSSHHEEIAALLDTDVAGALLRWAITTGRQIRVPASPWRRKGYTGAVLAPLFVTEPGSGTQQVVVKRLPSGQATEPEAHRRALREAPRTFRSHLVEQVFDPIMMPDGGAVMFQSLAGASQDWRPMANLPTACLPDGCGILTKALLGGWNANFVITSVNAVDFLIDEIDNIGSVGRHVAPVATAARPAWVCVEGDPMPDPLHLLTEASPFAGTLVDVVVGRVHGDLHDLNVLMKQGRRGQPCLDTFVLVDLMSYTSAGQLGRDVVRLLLSVAARLLPELSASQQRLLLPAFVRPEDTAPEDLPPLVVNSLLSVYEPAAELLSRCGAETWRRQYLLSLIAHGLVFTTYERLSPASRWWFYRLAGSAARELLCELELTGGAPTEVTKLSNPYVAQVSSGASPAASAPSEHSRHSASSYSIAPRPTYSAWKKIEVCRRLSDDWADLADLVGVPRHDRDGFAQGRRPHEVWEWLERRDRIHELPGALRALGRADLAEVLEPDMPEANDSAT
jgi:hypothetical protein